MRGRAALALGMLLSCVALRGQNPAERITRGNELLGEQQPAQALEQFQQALAQQPANIDALRGAGKSHEWLGHWPEAIQAFQRIADQNPADVESWFSLGRIHGWAGHADASNAAYVKALGLAPDRADIGAGYAEILSWNPRRRREAIARYQKILEKNPQYIPARVGLAQTQAWIGSIAEAQAGYRAVLAEDAQNVAALLGQAEIARWKGQRLEARRLVAQAADRAPGDSRVMKEAAETDLTMGRYASARRNARLVATTNAQWAEQIERQIDHAQRPYLEAGFNLRRDRQVAAPNRLDYNAYSAQLSLPFTAQGRLTFFSDHPLYRGDGRVRNASYSGARWELWPSYRVRSSVEALAEISPGRPKNASGSARVAIVASDWAQFSLGVDRRLVADSLQSARGSEINGDFTGQVHANLASWQNTLRIAPAAVDLYANLSAGFYQGHHLDRNWMGQIDAGVGKLLRNSQPSVRLGYGFTTFRFVQDQSFLPADGAAASRTGGYFSPRLFLNNFGILGFSGKFAATGEWQIEGTLGVQQVRDRYTDLETRKLSSTARAALWAPLGARLQLGAAYDFLNVGNSFRRNYFSGRLRAYF